MDLRHLKIFTIVCDCKSVTGAANKLRIAQPAVSLAIKELEDYYGISLFDRISHKLYITAEGEKLLQYARKIIALFDELESDIKDWDSFGTLRVGSSITIGTRLMPDFVKNFRSAYPKIKIYVTIDSSAEIEKKVLDQQLDLALIEGNTHFDSIISQKLLSDELVVVCGASSSFSEQPEKTIEELSELPFILRDKGSGTRELFDSVLLTKGITIIPEWESISTGVIISAIACGLGVSVLPYRLVERELSEKSLVKINIKGLKLERYFYLIYHKDKHLSKSALSFINAIYQTVEV